jgi:hypothetical protein
VLRERAPSRPNTIYRAPQPNRAVRGLKQWFRALTRRIDRDDRTHQPQHPIMGWPPCVTLLKFVRRSPTIKNKQRLSQTTTKRAAPTHMTQHHSRSDHFQRRFRARKTRLDVPSQRLPDAPRHPVLIASLTKPTSART